MICAIYSSRFKISVYITYTLILEYPANASETDRNVIKPSFFLEVPKNHINSLVPERFEQNFR